jgi:ABC-type transporter Mla maintaining outer membrane lipid asymmetry permease subunit MlaE
VGCCCTQIDVSHKCCGFASLHTYGHSASTVGVVVSVLARELVLLVLVLVLASSTGRVTSVLLLPGAATADTTGTGTSTDWY